jgi:hypothetical protein
VQRVPEARLPQPRPSRRLWKTPELQGIPDAGEGTRTLTPPKETPDFKAGAKRDTRVASGYPGRFASLRERTRRVRCLPLSTASVSDLLASARRKDVKRRSMATEEAWRRERCREDKGLVRIQATPACGHNITKELQGLSHQRRFVTVTPTPAAASVSEYQFVGWRVVQRSWSSSSPNVYRALIRRGASTNLLLRRL